MRNMTIMLAQFPTQILLFCALLGYSANAHDPPQPFEDEEIWKRVNSESCDTLQAIEDEGFLGQANSKSCSSMQDEQLWLLVLPKDLSSSALNPHNSIKDTPLYPALAHIPPKTFEDEESWGKVNIESCDTLLGEPLSLL
ncbi:hypothetical protein DFH28DRAFT_924722 [Melampsora americana]|nr:hypothetical protein DFH28DRAFT_924722 [Melampsora americana]